MTSVVAMKAQFTYRPFRASVEMYVISNGLPPIANACRSFWAANIALKGQQISVAGKALATMINRIIAPKVR
jgi:hypothetical protein